MRVRFNSNGSRRGVLVSSQVDKEPYERAAQTHYNYFRDSEVVVVHPGHGGILPAQPFTRDSLSATELRFSPVCPRALAQES